MKSFAVLLPIKSIRGMDGRGVNDDGEGEGEENFHFRIM